MSKGYGGYADLRKEDDTMLMYSYCSYNVNLDHWREMQAAEDGELWIERNALIEPEIHEHIKRMPSGRKQLQVKRIKKEAPVGELYDAGKITVKNASGTWKTLGQGVDMIAVSILHKLFDEYQETGQIPQRVGWFV